MGIAGLEGSFNEEFQGFEIVFVAGHLNKTFSLAGGREKYLLFANSVMGTAGISDSEIAIAS